MTEPTDNEIKFGAELTVKVIKQLLPFVCENPQCFGTGRYSIKTNDKGLCPYCWLAEKDARLLFSMSEFGTPESFLDWNTEHTIQPEEWGGE